MDKGNAIVLAATITGVFGYVLARLQSSKEIAQLRQQRVLSDVVEKDFAPLIDWLNAVEGIAMSTTTHELKHYQCSAAVLSCAMLLDIRFKCGWRMMIINIDKGIQEHKSHNTCMSNELKCRSNNLNSEVIWLYQRQRDYLSARAPRRLIWCMNLRVKRYIVNRKRV